MPEHITITIQTAPTNLRWSLPFGWEGHSRTSLISWDSDPVLIDNRVPKAVQTAFCRALLRHGAIVFLHRPPRRSLLTTHDDWFSVRRFPRLPLGPHFTLRWTRELATAQQLFEHPYYSWVLGAQTAMLCNDVKALKLHVSYQMLDSIFNRVLVPEADLQACNIQALFLPGPDGDWIIGHTYQKNLQEMILDDIRASFSERITND